MNIDNILLEQLDKKQLKKTIKILNKKIDKLECELKEEKRKNGRVYCRCVPFSVLGVLEDLNNDS